MKRLKSVAFLGLMSLLCTTASAQQSLICTHPMPPAPPVTPARDFSSSLPLPDSLDSAIECSNANLPPGAKPDSLAHPRSEWLESEKRLYTRALAQHKTDVLIVPFQIQGFGLDRIERALMSADLAYALSDNGAVSVADPFMVSRALGEGLRRFPADAVEQLAEQLGARYVVTSYVGHDGQHTFTLTIQVRDRKQEAPSGASQQVWQHDWRSVRFTDEQTPSMILHPMLPEITHVLPLPARRRSRRPVSGAWPERLRVTSELHGLNTQKSPYLPPMATLAFLGALSPSSVDLPRERLFERAWLAGLYDKDTSADSRFFRAYVLMQLTRRPLALNRLNGLSSGEANTLRALLDGNLPAAEEALGKLPDTLERLLLALSVRDLEAEYGRKLHVQPQATEAVFGPERAYWSALVQARANAADPWSTLDPLFPKAMLDNTFPVPGMDLETVVRGTAVARGETPDAVALDLINVRHTRRVTETLPPPTCCSRSSLGPGDWDDLWLLEALGEARIVTSLYKTFHLQGLTDAALDKLSRYEPLLAGDPELEAERADVLVAIAQKSPDDERLSRLADAERSAAIAASALPGQSSTTLHALSDMGVPSPKTQFMVDGYGYDYPRRSYWPMKFLGTDPFGRLVTQFASEALQFSTHDMAPVFPLLRPELRDDTLAAVAVRFQGNPQRQSVLPSTAPALSAPSVDATLNLRKAVQQDPETWNNYLQLGAHLLQYEGNFEEAQQAFLSYPRFHEKSPDDPVGTSNYAGYAGSIFYSLGLADLAKPLYRIAADLQTGSAAGMQAAQRLKTLEGDHLGALSLALERAERYSDFNAYRDYLSLLHVTGHGEEAWQAFAQVNASFESPQIWVSVLVGQRLQGMREEELRRWLTKPEIRDAQFRTRHFAPYEALWTFSTDRLPPADLGALVEKLEGPPVARVSRDTSFTQLPVLQAPDQMTVARASSLRDGKRPTVAPGTPVKSELAYFADAYAALRHRDYAAAVARFNALADHYPIEEYPLAYFAYAAAKTGDGEHLEQYIDELRLPPSFDQWLAKAFFAGARKDPDTALKALQNAYRIRPFTQYRPVLTEYQYADACELLYQDTRDDRFIAELLDWTRKQQLVQPTSAWAFAMQYQYEKPGPERVRALAMTEFLDPASPRIAPASKRERELAGAWLKQNNPFAVPAEPRKPATNTPI